VSLTAHLKCNGSPVRRFFERKLPGAERIVPIAGGHDWPREPKVLPLDTRDYPWSPVGMALDYRLRYFFRVTPMEELVAAYGAVILGLKPVCDLLSSAIDDLTMAHDPHGRVLPMREELTLCRYCYLLALFEQGFRAGYSSSLAGINPDASIGKLLPLCEDRVADDLASLSALFAETQADLYKSAQFALNPTFSGSRSLGGADADLIAGKRLVEIKTLKGGQPDAIQIWQLAGYALADWDD